MKKWERLVATLFPALCAVCDQLAVHGSPFCNLCELGAEPLHAPCARCAMPHRAHACAACRAAPPHFDAAHAPYLYEGAPQRAVLRLKLSDQPALAMQLAAAMRRALAVAHFDLVVPVPLHPRRLRSRGYNSSALLAAQLHVGRVSASVLTRVRDTPCQNGLNRVERQRNVHGAFVAQRALVGARVLLVDDVLTTGATANECARELKSAGAATVHVLTVARAVT